MKKLKDFFYDKNDILIALAILIIAALLIVWRMEIIMDYPRTLAEETGTLILRNQRLSTVPRIPSRPTKSGQPAY